MSLWLLIAVWGSLANAAPTSQGPTSPEEMKILYQEGTVAFQDQRYQDAVNAFQRIVDRYPSTPGYPDAQLKLGLSYSKLSRYKEALPPLRSYVQFQRHHLEGTLARIPLAQVYLQLGNAQQANLVASEILNRTRADLKNKSNAELHAHAQILKAEALIGLKKIKRADQTQSHAKKELTALGAQASTALKADFYALQLRLKLLACSDLLALHSRLTEDQTLNQAERRGACFLEALLIFKDVLMQNEVEPATWAASEISKNYREFDHQLRNPPAPSDKRSADELKKYRQELSGALLQKTNSNYLTSLDIIKSWGTQLPPDMLPRANWVSQDIRSLRNPKE